MGYNTRRVRIISYNTYRTWHGVQHDYTPRVPEKDVCDLRFEFRKSIFFSRGVDKEKEETEKNSYSRHVRRYVHNTRAAYTRVTQYYYRETHYYAYTCGVLHVIATHVSESVRSHVPPWTTPWRKGGRNPIPVPFFYPRVALVVVVIINRCYHNTLFFLSLLRYTL